MQLLRPVIHPSAWQAENMARSDAWIVRPSPEIHAELAQAVQTVLASGLRAPDFGKTDFPLPTAEPWLRGLIDEVSHGRGFLLLRGLPLDPHDKDAMLALFWGLGCHWGTAITQNLAGDFVAEIRDLGLDVNNLNVKPSLTNAEQRPHSDPGDIVALLCASRAAAGGTSRIASTMSIYNALLDEQPESLGCLYRGFHHDLRGDASESAPYGCTPVPIPVYRHYGGVLSCVFNASTIKDAQRRMHVQVPAAEMAVIDRMVELARSDAMRLDMDFEPGDIQLLNNHTTMHWRTGFTDHPEPALRRRLFRLWLDRPGERPVDPAMQRGYITGSQAGVSVKGGASAATGLKQG